MLVFSLFLRDVGICRSKSGKFLQKLEAVKSTINKLVERLSQRELAGSSPTEELTFLISFLTWAESRCWICTVQDSDVPSSTDSSASTMGCSCSFVKRRRTRHPWRSLKLWRRTAGTWLWSRRSWDGRQHGGHLQREDVQPSLDQAGDDRTIPGQI